MESFDCPAILQPGASCEVRCRFPFVGSATFAPRHFQTDVFFGNYGGTWREDIRDEFFDLPEMVFCV